MWALIISVPTGQIVDAMLNLAGNSELWNYIWRFREVRAAPQTPVALV